MNNPTAALPKGDAGACVGTAVTALLVPGDRPGRFGPGAWDLMDELELARVPGVTRLAFGAIELALILGADSDSAVFDYGRAQIVFASRAAGIAAPFDSPFIAVAELQAVRHPARIGRGFGFGGKLCIHPDQFKAVIAAITPRMTRSPRPKRLSPLVTPPCRSTVE